MGRLTAWFVGWFAALSMAAVAVEPPRVLDLRVLEREGGKPVAGASVVRVVLERVGSPSVTEPCGATDADGHVSVPVPPDDRKLRSFGVYVWRDGYVPIEILWGYNREFEFEGVPATYTVVLDRGDLIGGVVRDEQGRPVAGARVFPTLAGAGRGEIERYELPPGAGFTTDVDGRWRCAILPGWCGTGEMTFRVEHPGFLGGDGDNDRRQPIRDLRARTSVMVLRRGFTLAGTVADDRGRPIEGATIICLTADGWDHEDRTRTAAGGRFRFEGRPPGLSMIAVEAPGRAVAVKLVELGPHGPGRRSGLPMGIPELPDAPMVPVPMPATPVPGQAVRVPAAPLPAPAVLGLVPPGPDPVPELTPPAVSPSFFQIDASQTERDGPCDPPLEVRLGPGGTIRGRVVDSKGRPVAGARVEPNLRGYSGWCSWRAVTGEDGRFRWENAPIGDYLIFDVEDAEGLRKVRRSAPGAGQEEWLVRLPVPFRLRGKVVDAETGRPIERPRLLRGIGWTYDFAPTDNEMPPDWSRTGRETIDGKGYEIGFPHAGPPPRYLVDYPILVVRAEAEGYSPEVSPRYGANEGEQDCDFRMHRHPWIVGTVRAPDGSPAAGASVAIAAKGGPSPWVYNGRIGQGWRGDVVRAGPDGRYAFDRPDAGGRVVFVSDRGMAQRTVDELAADPMVTLEPWGRIRGELRVGAGLGERRIVGAHVVEQDYRGAPFASFWSRALTDAEGRFVLEHVAPGHAMAYRPHWQGGAIFHSHRQGVEVGAGQTAEIIMGGAGRPIVGRLARAEGLPAFDLSRVGGRLKLVQPLPVFPDGFEDWDEGRRDEWWFAYYRTEEGRTFYERAASYVVKVQPDGLFRLDDVPEGTYRLRLEYATPAGSDLEAEPPAPKRIAELRLDVEIPAGPDDRPFDLGTMKLQPPASGAVDR